MTVEIAFKSLLLLILTPLFAGATPGTYKAQLITVLTDSQFDRLTEAFSQDPIKPTKDEMDLPYKLLEDMRRLDLRTLPESAVARGIRVFGLLLGKAIVTDARVRSNPDPRKNIADANYKPEESIAVLASGFNRVRFAEKPFQVANIDLLLYWQEHDHRSEVQSALKDAWTYIAESLRSVASHSSSEGDFLSAIVTLEYLLPRAMAYKALRDVIERLLGQGDQDRAYRTALGIARRLAIRDPLKFADHCGSMLLDTK